MKAATLKAVLEVATVTVAYQQVEVAANCPKCSAELTKPGALLLYGLQNGCRDMRLTMEEVDEPTTWDSDGQDEIAHCFDCRNCGHTLAKGGVEFLTAEQAAKVTGAVGKPNG